MKPLKGKLDKLHNMMMRTGNPFCRDHVKRAKRILNAIMARSSAVCIGLDVEDEEGKGYNLRLDCDPYDGVSNISFPASHVGNRARMRTPGAGGVKSHRVSRTKNAMLGLLLATMVALLQIVLLHQHRNLSSR